MSVSVSAIERAKGQIQKRLRHALLAGCPEALDRAKGYLSLIEGKDDDWLIETALEKAKEARFILVHPRFGHPYFAQLAYWCRFNFDPNLEVLAAVDREGNIWLGPLFALLEEEEAVGVLWHELRHLLEGLVPGENRFEAMKARAMERGVPSSVVPTLLNIASDMAINDDAKRLGKSLPSGLFQLIFPERYRLPSGLPAEEYLERLLDSENFTQVEGGAGETGIGGGESEGKGEGEGKGEEGSLLRQILSAPKTDELREAEGGEEGRATHLQLLRRSTAQAVLAHYKGRKERGDVPLGLLRWAEGHLEPRIPWQRVLANALESALGSGSRRFPTYARLHRRASSYYPVLFPGADTLSPRVAVVADTSGSMGEEEMGIVVGETLTLVKRFGEVFFLATDASVHSKVRVRRRGEVLAHLKGGGGTDMVVGIKEAIALKERPDVVVVITDGYTPWPEEPLEVPVVAVITSQGGSAPPSWIKAVYVKR